MENPRTVIGTSNRQSYYNDQNSMGGSGMGGAADPGFQNNDLYEFEETTTKKVINNAKQLLGSINGNANTSEHSPSQYKRDFLDSLCVQVNQTLIIPKLFYFFFFAAFGSLFPLMAIYFKQMAMSPYQVGILFGFKPFVEFFSVPFWANISERYRKGKVFLIISLTCWILFTVGVGLIKPPVKYCLMHNESNIFLENVKSNSKPSETLPKNIIVSGGSSVISKRSVDYTYFNEYDSIQKNRQDSVSSNMEVGYIGALLLKKRANDIDDDDDEPKSHSKGFKVVNVTKIIRRTKKTTTTTQATTPTATQLDELEFKPSSAKGKLITKATKSTTTEKSTKKSKISEAIDQIENNVVKESQVKDQKSNKEKSSDKSEVVTESINSSINDLVNKTISNKGKVDDDNDDGDDDDDNDLKEGNSKLQTKSSTSKIGRKKEKTTSSTTPPVVLQSEAPKVEKSHYFHPTALETKNKKIIMLNHSVYDLVKPNLLTSVVYIRSDVHKIFIVFLVFILVGEFFSAPAITLADTCTLQYLGPTRSDLYGRQRMFGSLGWGIAMFIVGLLLDRSKAFTDHPCGMAGPDERNYTVCFAIFSVLMGGALIIATQMNFNYGDNEEIPLKSIVKTQLNKVRGVQNSQFDRKKLVNEGDDGDEFTSQYGGESDRGPSEYSNHQSRGDGFNEIGVEESSKQRYIRLLKICFTVKHLSFLFMVWFMGIGVGLVFTFLFWHLQDLGGSPTLYGIASVINHVSELAAYYFVDKIVVKFGHIKIFYAALLGNAIRFVYVSLLSQPYWILPFEFIQGITHALLWATATSYFAQSVPDDLRSTAQGILQSVHFGLGRGCGSVIGGILITVFETKITFGVYGILSLFCMFILIAINLWSSDMNAKQTPLYGQNQMANDDDYNNFNNNNKDQMPEINNAVNPRMMDSNYYYQPTSNNDKGQPAKSVPMVPHGVPGGAVNWSKH